MREASYTQSFRCLMKRAPQYKYIGCNPFSGRLTHSTRQMREHKTVSPNYRRLSTSTIVLCDEKILREMMLKLNDVCDCDEQFSWIVWVCVCFLGEKKKKWLLRPPSRCLLFRRLWFWCYLLLLLKQNLVLQLWFLLKTFSHVFWQSDQAVIQNCCGCVQHLECSMFDGGWTLLLNCCSQHSLFIVEILIIERIRISLYDVSNIHILLCSELVNEG